MEADTPYLPSTLEKTVAPCPKFRIVLIGDTGVGKSSLVSRVFNISLQDINIQHDQPGEAEITRGYTSEKYPRLILHDSKGFESGSTATWDTMEEFLRERSARQVQLQDRVHAIWLCVTTPRDGSRLLQTGEEKLLGLAQELEIPIIVVCTKYDILINEQSISAQEDGDNPSETELEKRAETCFRDRVNTCEALKQASIVRVSTKEDYPKRIETLQELTSVTYRCLIPQQVLTSVNRPGDSVEEPSSVIRPDDSVQELVLTSVIHPDGSVEEPTSVIRPGDSIEGPVSDTWIITQQIDPGSKVELSIREGFKKYWRNLGKSAFFQGQTLDRCVWRIHDDIVQAWGLTDPQKLLSNRPFIAKMIGLVEPMLGQSEGRIQQDDFLKNCGDALAAATAIATPFAPYLVGVGIGILTLKFLYGKYKQLPLTAQYLGAYIVDLTCVLFRLFTKTLLTKSPMALSEDLIFDVVESYEKTDLYRVHCLVREMNFVHRFEDQIAKLIRVYTSQSQATSTFQPPNPISLGDRQLRAQSPDAPSSRVTPTPNGPTSSPPLVDRRSTPRPSSSTQVLATRTPNPNQLASDSKRGRRLRTSREGCIMM